MDQEVQKQLMTAQMLRREAEQLAQKIAELDVESHDHGLVISTIEDLDPERRCYRLVHSVLVERTVGQVLPDVQESKEKIDNLIKSFRKQLVEKESKADEIFRSVQKIAAESDKQTTIKAGSD